jgi:hypothetical protein
MDVHLNSRFVIDWLESPRDAPELGEARESGGRYQSRDHLNPVMTRTRAGAGGALILTRPQ